MAKRSDETFEPTSIFGATLRFKGELHADEDLLIRGQVEGSISHSKQLTVAREGRVQASIRGHIVRVEGQVDGDVSADTSVAVLAGSVLTGDVSAPSVSIVKGASCTGKVSMSDAKPARVSRAPTLASSAPELPQIRTAR